MHKFPLRAVTLLKSGGLQLMVSSSPSSRSWYCFCREENNKTLSVSAECY